MKKYASARGKVYTAAFAAVLVLMIVAFVLSAIYVVGATKYILCGFYVLVVAAALWCMFGTDYTFTDDALVCRCGPFAETIPYGKLRTATKCKGYVFSMALSELRIELRYGKRDTDTVFVSPVDEDEFLTDLMERCEKCEVYEA